VWTPESINLCISRATARLRAPPRTGSENDSKVVYAICIAPGVPARPPRSQRVASCPHDVVQQLRCRGCRREHVPHHHDVVEQVERLRRAPLLLALAAPVGPTLAASRPSRDGSLGSASPVLSRRAATPQCRRLVQPWCDERLGPDLETSRGAQRPARIGSRRTAAAAAAAKNSVAPRSRRKRRAAFTESPPAAVECEQTRRRRRWRRRRRQQRWSSRTVHPHLVSRVARVHLVREIATLVGDAAWMGKSAVGRRARMAVRVRGGRRGSSRSAAEGGGEGGGEGEGVRARVQTRVGVGVRMGVGMGERAS